MTSEQENKRLRELLRDCRMIVREVGYPKLAASIDTALSQQAEPAPAQAEQQPFGWVTEDYLTDKSATTYDQVVADRWRAKGWPVREIYAAPIAQTAPQGTTSDTLIKSAKALLALDEKGSLAPHGIGGLAREVIEKLIARVEQTAPQPEPSGLSLPRTRLERIERRLTDWLELNCCECESGHSCGRNEVTADRDAIRAALSAQGESHE